MDQLIRAVALLIDKKIDMIGLTVDDIKVLNDVLELAQALDESAPRCLGKLGADTIQAIRKGYEEYLVGRITTSYSLTGWFAHTAWNRDLTDKEITAILDADVDLAYGDFSTLCNGIITNANKERA